MQISIDIDRNCPQYPVAELLLTQSIGQQLDSGTQHLNKGEQHAEEKESRKEKEVATRANRVWALVNEFPGFRHAEAFFSS